MEKNENKFDLVEQELETETTESELIEVEIIEEAETGISEESAEIEEANGIEQAEKIEPETIVSAEVDEETSTSDGAEDPAPAAETSHVDDLTSVAEGLAAMRNPFVVPQKAVNGADTAFLDDDWGDTVSSSRRDDCGLFKGFTLKKALVTASAVLVTLAVLTATMAAAIAVTGDKTRRTSDYDMIDESEAENAARELSANRAPLEADEAIAQFKVTLDFFDREDIELYSTKMTLADMLAQSEIELLKGEEATIPLDTMIGNESTITFDKYEETSDVVTETIPYESEVIETDLIPRGSTNYIQYGANGTTEKTFSVKLKNGEEISRELAYETVAEYPTKEIYELGVGGSFVGGDGKTYTYSYRRIVKATYYYLPNDPTTYLGNTPDNHTIAVDMSVIPLGTWLYVKNDRFDFGLRQAQDIGGAIKGDMIDIWLDGSEPGYSSFVSQGLHNDMEVYYVD